MTSLLQPFTGYVPAAEFARRVVGPPVSTLSPDQREAARLDPLSFRHVVGKGAGTSVEEAQQWVRACNEQGVLRPVGPALLVYRLTHAATSVTGLIGEVSIAAYDSGLIKRHETTISRTELKMARYMRKTRVYGNPVALAYRENEIVSNSISARVSAEADYSFDAADGSRHQMWKIEGEAAASICQQFRDELYITDGHHRLAAASHVAAREGRLDPHLPAGLFSSGELHVRSFARCIVDPDIDVGEIVARIRDDHVLEPISRSEIRPSGRFEFGVELGGETYRMRIRPELIPNDVYQSLDVNLLQDLILEPLFGVTNPRNDPRLHFIADQPGADEDQLGCQAWFLPYPASIADVMTVADSGLAMPPKSTLFTPKLPSGLVIRELDRT